MTRGARDASAKVRQSIDERLRKCPYAFAFNRVTWRFDDGTLLLRGRVTSFHLKQVLQTILIDVRDVERLVNEMRVVSATGLSSG